MMSIWVIIGEFKLPAGIYLLKIAMKHQSNA